LRLRKTDATIGETYVAVFTGRGNPEMCQEVLGDLMAELNLWSPLRTPEELAEHNAALRILAKMNALVAIDPKAPGKVTLVIVHESPADRQ